MEIENCEACGQSLEADTTIIHQVIPEDIRREANISDLRTVALCHTCYHILEDWNLKKVSNVTFDSESNNPRFKTPTEMIKEYVITYKFFMRYQRSQANRR